MRFVRRWMALALVAVGCATGSTDRAGLGKLFRVERLDRAVLALDARHDQGFAVCRHY